MTKTRRKMMRKRKTKVRRKRIRKKTIPVKKTTRIIRTMGIPAIKEMTKMTIRIRAMTIPVKIIPIRTMMIMSRVKQGTIMTIPKM